MNDRERFVRIMRYEAVDRLPVLALEPYEKQVLDRWHSEGLPANQTPEEFLGMSSRILIPFSLGAEPPFEERIVAEDDEYITRITTRGTTLRCRKDAPSTYYGHVDFPVKTRSDWEEYKQHFIADSPARSRPAQDADLVRRLNEAQDPVGVCFFPFFFRLGFYSMGMERFLTAFHDEPDLIHDMFSHWSKFVIDMLRPMLEMVRVDFAIFGEDLAGKNGPLVSPRTYENFWYLYQDPIINLLREHGVEVICQWSAGEFDALLPKMIEHGFNCTWPLERMAGMDALDLRQRYGRDLLLGGNIAKEALITGPDAIDAEIAQLMPLVKEGGFIPALDDMVPLEVPFSHYRHLVEQLQSCLLD